MRIAAFLLIKLKTKQNKQNKKQKTKNKKQKTKNKTTKKKKKTHRAYQFLDIQLETYLLLFLSYKDLFYATGELVPISREQITLDTI